MARKSKIDIWRLLLIGVMIAWSASGLLTRLSSTEWQQNLNRMGSKRAAKRQQKSNPLPLPSPSPSPSSEAKASGVRRLSGGELRHDAGLSQDLRQDQRLVCARCPVEIKRHASAIQLLQERGNLGIAVGPVALQFHGAALFKRAPGTRRL